MFGFRGKRYNATPMYREARPFTEPSPQAAYVTWGVPTDALLGNGGQQVIGQLAAFQPAYFQPWNGQVLDNVYGSGGQPNYPTTQQPLTRNPLGDPATTQIVGSM